MSRFDLRDVSSRVTRSRDAKAVANEFLRSIEAARPEWRASLAFYEVSRDAFVDVLGLEDGRLIRREIVVSTKDLPDRLVRKLFGDPPGNQPPKKKALFSAGLGTTPHYVAEASDASKLLPLTVLSEWRSCVCFPLGDQSDLMGILVIVSTKANAFGGRAVSEILPVKSLVTVALAKHLRRAEAAATWRPAPEPAPPAASEPEPRPAASAPPLVQTAPPAAPAASATGAAFETPAAEESLAFDTANEVAAALRAELDDLARYSRESGDDATPRAAEGTPAGEDPERKREQDAYRTELDRAKSEMAALEAEAVGATERLTATYAEMNETSWQMADLERRMAFARRCLILLGEEPDEQRLSNAFVNWLGDDLGVERCSLMTLDDSGEVLQIAAQRGIDAAVTAHVRVRLGQGVAGWVALNRKPLLVRMRSQADITPETQSTTYNSESFIAVPVVHNGRLYGVLNFSNKRGGELFNGVDFDCASLAGAALALRFSSVEPSRGGMARAA